jgi:hypothetical protein
MNRHIRSACVLAIVVGMFTAAPASAAVDSWFTAGVGAQYSIVSDGVAQKTTTPGVQYGLVGRLKILKFLGIEMSTAFDQDPKTQDQRHLSPRYQIGAMVNVVPTRWFNLFVVAGTGAHGVGDLFDINGDTTSFHAGPGLEIFIGEHFAFGGDVRFRVPGPTWLKDQVKQELSLEPVNDATTLDVWQVNLLAGVYL